MQKKLGVQCLVQEFTRVWEQGFGVPLSSEHGTDKKVKARFDHLCDQFPTFDLAQGSSLRFRVWGLDIEFQVS